MYLLPGEHAIINAAEKRGDRKWRTKQLCACPRADMASSSEAAGASHVPDQPQIFGVVHAGGQLQDATLPRQTPAIIRAVFAPKHYGAANIKRVRAFAVNTQQLLLCHELP